MCKGAGNLFNMLFRRNIDSVPNPNNDNIANITLPSISRLDNEINHWNLDNNGEFNTKLNLNTLNFFGCLVFILLFVIYFFMFSSLFLYLLEKISVSTNNLKSIVDMTLASTGMNSMTTANNTKLNSGQSDVNQQNDNFLMY
uniref:Uncharacterized protein n=1 Tax=Gracilaria firma TaxID=2510791 RepID=A0A1P8D6L3_9FLOR|nr:hypothetical protein [Gracilaria firma]APR74439.1 hypothetical protein [Gracilaria firma]